MQKNQQHPQESLEISQKMLRGYDNSLGRIIRLKPRKSQSEDPLTERESG
jgi:hypothetical protein